MNGSWPTFGDVEQLLVMFFELLIFYFLISFSYDELNMLYCLDHTEMPVIVSFPFCMFSFDLLAQKQNMKL